MLHDALMPNDNCREHRSIEERLACIEVLLLRLLNQEEDMAANESAEATALQAAIDGLNAEIADTSTVDGEIVTEIEGLKEALGKVEPVSPEQVNAITAATTSLTSLTAKLKAVEPAPAPPAEPGPPAELAAPVAEATGTTPPPAAEGNTPAQ